MLRRLVLATLICIALLTVACIGGGRGYDSARRVISSALADEAGNTYVAYRAERSPGDHDIHVLKIDREGRKLWDKTLFTGDNRRSSILGIVKDGGGGVFIAWEVLKPENGKEGPHHFDRDFLAKVDGQGEIKLEQDFLFRITDMAADGTGGVTLRRITSAERYVLRLDGEGSTLWEYPLSSQCTGLQLAAGDEGEWFILWRHAENSYFIVQKLGADGQTLWRDDGAPASEGVKHIGVRIKHLGTALKPEPRIISDGVGGAFVSWSEPAGGSMPSYIWICRIRADGSVLCTEPVRDLPSTTNVYTRLVPDGSGGAIAVWEDHRNGMKLYAQRVNDGGEELWQRNGMPVCSSLPEVSPRFEAIDSGNGNVAVAWIDGDRNLYAQMLDETGRKQWGDQGIPIAENVCEQPIVLTRVMQKEMLAGWCTGKSMHMPQRSFIQRLDIEGNTIGEPIGIGS